MLLGFKPEWQVPDAHFRPATPMSGDRTLHLYYSLLNLQKEIEKRTFYLGKYRGDAQAPHLLDLIGMSRDEADVLYPFAKSAMADVFDALNQSTVGLPKEYRWEDKKGILQINRRLQHATAITAPTLTVTVKESKLYISGTIDIGALTTANGDITAAAVSGDKVRPNLDVTLTYYTKRNDIATGNEIIIPHTETFTIDKIGIFPAVLDSGSYKCAVSYMHPVELKAQDGVSTREIILDASPSLPSATAVLTDDWEFTNPELVIKGTHFVVANDDTPVTEYEADEDFTENDLFNTADDASFFKVAHLVDTTDSALSEGIHYFIGFPNYLNDSLVEPLDNAILEALVNRVIWKWLCLAYPNEAQAYDTFYQQSVEALKTRCNIFRKNWAERKPRLY